MSFTRFTVSLIAIQSAITAVGSVPEWLTSKSSGGGRRPPSELAPILSSNAVELAELLNNDGSNSNTQHRSLQADPTEICDAYHAASSGQLSCTCNRYDRRDTQVYCEFNEQFCTQDQKTCYAQSIDILLNADAKSYRTTTCTNETTAPVGEPSETCITISPNVPEIYNMTIACAVTQNGQLCSSCEQCGPEELNENMTQAISFSCCNVETDLKQTCGAVSNQGGASAVFDVIPPEDKGKCSGATDSALSFVTFTVITAVSSFMLASM